MKKKKPPLKNTTPVSKVVLLDERRNWELVEMLCLRSTCHANWAKALPEVQNATAYEECPKCGSKKIVAIRGDAQSFEFSPESAKKMDFFKK